MKIILNGEEKEIKEEITITSLLAGLKLNSDITVVEINSEIIDKNKYEEVKIKENDAVELIRFVGGG